MDGIYLDHGATSWPKPEGVSRAMKDYLDHVGANINRSVYGVAQEAGLVTLRLRERLKRLFHFPEPVTHVILTPGMTWSVNTVLQGYLQAGDHVLISSMEHNAVMRCLNLLGVVFDRIPCDRQGFLDPRDIEPLLRSNTKMVIVAHGSNVCGSVQDAEAIGRICAQHHIPFVLDAAQTAGHLDVDFQRFRLSALCVPGHKGLLGPSGIGALLMTDSFVRQVRPLVAGGTGSASDSEFLPDYLPDLFESGTPNLPGIYGLEAALRYLEETGISTMRAREMALCSRFLDGLSHTPKARLCGTKDLRRRVGVISVDLSPMDNAEASFRLEQEFGILTRCGLHCAPSAHKTLGTFPQGTVRFSLGYGSTEQDVDAALSALRVICG